MSTPATSTKPKSSTPTLSTSSSSSSLVSNTTTPNAKSSSRQPKYEEGEKILCYHGALIYEAKCLKVDASSRHREPLYFVHYNGWNKHWDEWVDSSRILKLNEENLRKQQELIVANARSKGANNKAASSGGESPSTEQTSSQPPPLPPPPSPAPSQQLPTSAKKNSASNSNVSAKSKQLGHTATSSDTDTESSETSTTSTRGTGTKRSAAVAAAAAVVAIINQQDSAAAAGVGKKNNSATASTPSQQQQSQPPQQPPKKKTCIINLNTKHNKFLTNKSMNIVIPECLKEWLVDDYDAVNAQDKVVRLPCRKTAANILDDYVQYKLEQQQLHVTTNADDETATQQPPLSAAALQEHKQGLVKYFNAMLGPQLLYKFERVQYTDVLRGLNKDKKQQQQMSEIYGAVHLLRLFERLKQMLCLVPLEASALEPLVATCNDVMVYMAKHERSLFSLDDYVLVPPEYIRLTL